MVRWCSILVCAELVVAVVALLLHAVGICELYYTFKIALGLLFVAVISGIIFSPIIKYEGVCFLLDFILSHIYTTYNL